VAPGHDGRRQGAFSESDFAEDLKAMDVPALIMHGDDDQIVPIADSALLAAELVKKGTLKVYKGLRRGCAPRIRSSSIRILLSLVGTGGREFRRLPVSPGSPPLNWRGPTPTSKGNSYSDIALLQLAPGADIDIMSHCPGRVIFPR
jgi:hypothetical protein